MAVVTAAVAVSVSALFALTLLRRWWARGRTNRALLIWGVALVMFCTASTALLVGPLNGWTSAEFRLFYVFGAVLNVPWLALGSIAVNASRASVSRWTGVVLLAVAVLVARQALAAELAALWWPSAALALGWAAALLVGRQRVVVGAAALVLIVFSALAAAIVLAADYVEPLPTSGVPEGAEVFAPIVRGFAVAGNSVGAVTVVVSALVSSAVLVWRRPARDADRQLVADARVGGYAHAIARWLFRGRTGAGEGLAHLVRGNLLVGLGVAIAAAGGVLSFLGDTVGHAIAFTIGVSVMYAGFVRTTRPVDP
ncbi:MAG: hypothetical protein WD011_03230 [Nitriliruptoraceae bacterium]